MSTISYPSWAEYFTNHPTVDHLNNRVQQILSASNSDATSTAASRFNDASLFSNCCALGMSALKGHVIFLHHFHKIGNHILDPDSVHHLAISSISSQSEMTLIDPNVTFHVIDTACPSFDNLVGISNTNDLSSVPPAAADLENCHLAGVIFVPPFLLNEILSIHKTDIPSIYFQVTATLRSWAANETNNDSSAEELLNFMSAGKPLLQWLWSAHHSQITPSPLHPCLSPIAEQWKRQLHREFIQSGSSTPPPQHASRNRIVSPLDVNTNDQLSTSLAKLAATFERNSLEASKKDRQQNPNWDRLSTQAQQTILRAMTNNCHSAATAPTESYSEFLSQRSAATAQQNLIKYFESNHRARNACINQGMTSALWTGILCAPKIGSPENLSPFFVPRRSTSGTASSAPNLIGQHLKQVEGQGLDSTEIKLATKQKISIPNDFHEFHHQIQNYLLLLKSLFGPSSILFLRLEAIAQHISSYESEYEERQGANSDFYAEFLSLLDRRVQTFLEYCSNTPDVSKIDFTILSFDSVLRGVLDGTFKADLPSPIRIVLTSARQPKDKDPDKTSNPPSQSQKRSGPSFSS